MADDKPAPNGLEVANHHEILNNQEKSQNAPNVEVLLQTNEDNSRESRENDCSEGNAEKLLAEVWSPRKPLWSIASVKDLFKYWPELSKTLGKSWPRLGQYEETITIPEPIIPTNHIKLLVEKDRSVYEYKVEFVPKIGNSSYQHHLLNQALGHLSTTKVLRELNTSERTKDHDTAFLMYLPSQYITDKQEFEGVIADINYRVTTMITFKQKRKMQECPEFFNNLLEQIKDSLHTDGDHTLLSIRKHLESYPGGVSVVKEVEDGLLLICQDGYWNFWNRRQEESNIYKLLQEYEATDPENSKEIATKNLTGSIVVNSCNNKIYTIEGISWNKTPRDTFVDHGNVPITLTDYHKCTYDIDIKDINQPLLTSKVTKTVDCVKQENLIYLVPQLSYISGFTIRNDFMVEANDGSQRQIKAETVYELLQEYQRANPSNFQEIATKNLTGLVVFNPHNKRTYIVSDIAWDMTPRDTYFNDAGVPTTYINCYKRRYNIDIQDKTQPLLKNAIITTAGGYNTEDLLHLIPEFSCLTGLAYTRRDYLIQKNPWSPTSFFANNDERMVTLRTYLEKVQSSEAVRKVLADWGLTMVDAARVEASAESRLTLKSVLSHHVPIKEDTVYDLLQEHQAATSDFKDTATKNIIGEVVLTKYNNKTRKIEDIDWYTTPRDAFIEQGNVLTPYIDYYKRQYNTDIQDVGQPLLISKFTTKVDGVKQEKLLYLVPELSLVCGLSSRIREYYEQEVAIRRGTIGLALYIFLNKMRSSEKAQKVLAGWGLRMEDAARMVPPQEEFPSEEE